MTYASQGKKSALVTKDGAGNTPLINAVIFGSIEEIRSIASLGGTALNAQGWAGNTALHMAVLLGNAAALRVLLAAPGIDKRVLNVSGRTAMALAREHHVRKIERAFRHAAAQAQRRGAGGKTSEKAIVRTRRAPFCATGSATLKP